jgi:hypothetical protein
MGVFVSIQLMLCLPAFGNSQVEGMFLPFDLDGLRPLSFAFSQAAA